MVSFFYMFFYVFILGIKVRLCEAWKFVGRGGTQSCEARFPSPHPAPLGTPLFCVVVGVNVLTGCGIRGCREGEAVPICWVVDNNKKDL